MSSKVFGIGLSKTGTTSLCAALRSLGFATADYHEHYQDGRGVGTWFSGDFQTDCLVGYEAAVDLPIPAYFEQLDDRYPGSKFILTLRDMESWITSARNFFGRPRQNGELQSTYARTTRLIVFGIDDFSEGRFRTVYERHLRNVTHHFRDRPDDLLTLNIEAGDGWDSLCPFLGRSIPEQDFPWANRSTLPNAEPSKTVSFFMSDLPGRTLAIAANFACEPVEESLEFWCRELELAVEMKLAFQDQFFQQMLDPESLFGRNTSGINVVLLRLEDIRGPTNLDASSGPSEQATALLDELTRAAPLAANSGTPLCIVLCPPTRETTGRAFDSRTLELAAAELRSACRDHPTISVFAYTQIAADYAVEDPFGEPGEERFQIPYSPEFYASLGTFLARRVHSRFASPYKVIAVDCDDTLWRGACGEIGVDGITIGPEHQAFQRRLIEQYDAGMLLCLCSRNREHDVLAVFQSHPDMILSREHLAATRINWDAKSENLQALARELGLGLESFVFIDNDPIVCAEVETNVPSVLTIQFPRLANQIEQFTNHIWAFDRQSSDTGGAVRTERLSESRRRADAEQKATSLRDFHERLNLDVQILELAREDVPRVSELSFRTNQFNFTSVRRTDSEIEEIRSSGDSICLSVHASDRFGDYGLIGLIIGVSRGDVLEVETFLLSCRALGRGIEHRMLARIGELALEKGLDCLEINFVKTERNGPAFDFLTGIADLTSEQTETQCRFEISPQAAAEVVFDVKQKSPARTAGISHGSPAIPIARAGLSARTKLLSRIPSELCNAQQILSAIRLQKGRVRSEVEFDYVAPESETEQRLAKIWAEVLDLDRVGLEDNFFLIGGHSLAMVKIISRARDHFGVEPTFQPFFADPCVRAAAAEVDQLLSESLAD